MSQTPEELREELLAVESEIENNPDLRLSPLSPLVLRLSAVGRQAVGRLDDIGAEVQVTSRRAVRSVVAGMVVFTVLTGVGLQWADDRRAAGDVAAVERDTARAYQRCLQNAQSAASSVVVRRVTQDVADRLEDFTDAVAAAAENPEVRRTARALSLEALKAVALNVVQPVVDCDRTYPQGPELTKKYGDRAPVLPSTTAR